MDSNDRREARSAPKGRALVVLSLLQQRLRRVGSLFALMFIVSMSALYLCERNAPGAGIRKMSDALWFGIVTLSTVGYGDLYPVTSSGRVIAGVFIVFTLLTVGILLTAFSEALLEVKRMEELGLIGTRMRGHILVCGFGPLARTAIQELLGVGQDVALLCERAEDLPLAKQLSGRGKLFVSFGDSSQEILRDRLNGAEASKAIVAYNDDSQNLIATLNVRAINPTIEIAVALRREELRQTLIASGVTYVATPNELGGRLVASAIFEPEVAMMIEDLTSAVAGGCDLQQRAAGEFAGMTVRDARRKLEDEDGPLLVGLASRSGGRATLNPHPRGDVRIAGEDILVVLARTE